MVTDHRFFPVDFCCLHGKLQCNTEELALAVPFSENMLRIFVHRKLIN